MTGKCTLEEQVLNIIQSGSEDVILSCACDLINGIMCCICGRFKSITFNMESTALKGIPFLDTN